MINHIGKLARRLKNLSQLSSYVGPWAPVAAGASLGRAYTNYHFAPRQLAREYLAREFTFAQQKNYFWYLAGKIFNANPVSQTYAYLHGRKIFRTAVHQPQGLVTCMSQAQTPDSVVLQTGNSVKIALTKAHEFLAYENEQLKTRLENMKQRLSEMETKQSCVVCMDEPRSVGYGCGHRIVCKSCDTRIGSDHSRDFCPFCRAPIETRLYFWT